jgi:hypothetical protein
MLGAELQTVTNAEKLIWDLEDLLESNITQCQSLGVGKSQEASRRGKLIFVTLIQGVSQKS